MASSRLSWIGSMLLMPSTASDREIGEQLSLSPRTVGSHLYRLFPKLGVTSRNQLDDILDEAGEAKSPGSSPV